MKSDFPSARLHLERAYDCLEGDDDTSRRAREALDLLVEAVAAMEFSKQRRKIVSLAAERAQKHVRHR